MDNEGKRPPSDKFRVDVESRLNNTDQWESLEAYAVGYIRDRFAYGPVGWPTDLVMEKIYLRLCFRWRSQINLRYSALKVLYELWLKQEGAEAPDTLRVH